MGGAAITDLEPTLADEDHPAIRHTSAEGIAVCVYSHRACLTT